MEKKFIISILILQIISMVFLGYWSVVSETRYRSYEQSMKAWKEGLDEYKQLKKQYQESLNMYKQQQEEYNRQLEEYKKQAAPK